MNVNSDLKIGIIGDFTENRPSHQATNEALRHGALHLGLKLKAEWLPTERLEENTADCLQSFDGLWCAPGSPYVSIKGALAAIRFARENEYPFIGTCGGFQHAVIEYAQNKLGIKNARHAEYAGPGEPLFITALSCSLVGETRTIFINKNALVYRFYHETTVLERYNCNFGLHADCQNRLEEEGFYTAGTDENGEARILELRQKQFYVATLFQPQLSSTPEKPHPLILAYLKSCSAFHDSRRI